MSGRLPGWGLTAIAWLTPACLVAGRAALGWRLLADHGLEVVDATYLQVDEETIAKVWRFQAAGFHPDRWPPATDQRPDRFRQARPGAGVWLRLPQDRRCDLLGDHHP